MFVMFVHSGQRQARHKYMRTHTDTHTHTHTHTGPLSNICSPVSENPGHCATRDMGHTPPPQLHPVHQSISRGPPFAKKMLSATQVNPLTRLPNVHRHACKKKLLTAALRKALDTENNFRVLGAGKWMLDWTHVHRNSCKSLATGSQC